MKPIKVFFNGERMRDIYPHATRWQVIKFRVRQFFIRVLRVAVVLSILFGAFKAGQSFFPNVIYAEKEVQVEVQASIPMLEKICKAESGGKQFKANGDVVRGKVNPSDIGICQINEPTWNDQARKLGYDIYTEQGNKDMAAWIFTHYGSDPWNSSKKNWK